MNGFRRSKDAPMDVDKPEGAPKSAWAPSGFGSALKRTCFFSIAPQKIKINTFKQVLKMR
jgi:hypothetical protein